MPKYTIEGIVLKNNNYKDSDKIYTVFTKFNGKISVTAKGVRKISSRRGGNMDTLNHIKAGISESPSGFKSLAEVNTLNSFKSLKGSLEISSKVYYLLELIHRFVEEGVGSTEIFNSLVITLNKLEKSKSELGFLVIVNSFELKLMEQLGYGVVLDKCVSCERPFNLDWKFYKFSASQGGLICEKCQKLGIGVSVGTAQVLNYIYLYNKKTLKNGKEHSIFSKNDVYAADEVIKFYVEDILEDTFKTARVFKSVH